MSNFPSTLSSPSSPIVFLSTQENIMGSGISRSRREETARQRRGGNYTALRKEPETSANQEAIKLVFSNEYIGYKFNFEEMLSGSAEVLGKGSYGTTYKATLSSGTTIAVKRLKDLVRNEVSQSGLELIIRAVRHPNIVAWNAYYYSRDEMLFVYDYYPLSVSDLFEGKNGVNLDNFDWMSRLNIAIGAARAIAHIHKQSTDAIHFHGNIKPSNVLLNSEGYGCISDVGLSSIIRDTPPLSITNYRASEESGNSRASDVYSFGVLLLQLLVRRFEPATSEGKINDFVRWGRSVCEGLENGEVFDWSLRDPESLDVVKETFDIGIQCAQKIPSTRPDMSDVVMKLEQIQEISKCLRVSV